jgi:protein-S-isoprenylcysteine O-methyltransferase
MASVGEARTDTSDVVCIAMLLGLLGGGGLFLAVCNPGWASLALYLSAVCFFHFAECYSSAAYLGQDRVGRESFLLDNTAEYSQALLFAVVEHVVERLVPVPSWLVCRLLRRLLFVAGLGCMTYGQLLRWLAMRTAGRNFSHVLDGPLAKDHDLATHGIYARMRHPAYTGFYWWAIGTQLLLANPICLAFYWQTLGRFFGERIDIEEKILLQRHGREYAFYRQSVRSGIPGVA